MTSGSKQRIIGAFVLFALALIFFPLLFDISGENSVDTSEKIPSMPEIEPEIIPEPQVMEDVAPPEPEEATFQPAVKAEPESPEPEPPALTPAGLPEAWVVQVGSFSEEGKANDLNTRLKGEGYKSYVETVSLPQGQMHRVFIGPNILKKDAVEAQRQVEERYRVQTILRKFEP